jgi:uncharacterized hydrophobic protein (TIGR00271 family)
MKRILVILRAGLKRLFNLQYDKDEDSTIIESISRNVNFKGANIWALIFAIFIASIGLNVNSTAVVIGAMLISPLMGPIMGIGLGIGINNFDLVKRGFTNFLTAVIVSIITSTLYFSLTPLRDAGSELLARTTPSIWDVFIAFFGGLAGIVAATRKEKTNVIPGVAIATALMPPLCTAGFGIANGKFFYFIGALYLFFINSVFICLATYLIVRSLKLNKTQFEDEARGRRVKRYILIIVVVTVSPSIYLAYKIVDKSIFESNANTFIAKEFNFKNTQVVNTSFNYNDGKKEISILLIGEELGNAEIDSLKKKMTAYNIGGAKLNIKQGLNAKQQIDFAQVKASILEDVFNKERKDKEIQKAKADSAGPYPGLREELRSLYPSLQQYTVTKSVFNYTDTMRKDTVVLFVGVFSKPFPKKDREPLQNWLKYRVHADSVKLVIE